MGCIFIFAYLHRLLDIRFLISLILDSKIPKTNLDLENILKDSQKGLIMQTLTIPAFNDNYIWLISDGEIAAVVDPGDPAPVLKNLESKNLKLKYILITHHHMDHVGGIKTLISKYPEVTVFGPDCGRIPGISKVVKESDTVEMGSLGSYNVMEVPGHTTSHICYYGEGNLYIGDTVFAAGCGRLFEGSPADMVNSFEKIRALPEATNIYCAHEYTLSNIRFAKAVDPDNHDLLERERKCQKLRENGTPTVPFTLEEELKTNPFFRYKDSKIRESASCKSGRAVNDDVTTFAIIRSWKDSF